MQFSILPTLIAIATIFCALVSAAPAKRSSYEGTATFFSPESSSEGGNEGACWGTKMDDSSKIVALNAEQYGNMSKNSKWCGKKIRISGPKGTATATIIDACPGCKYGDLDLTPALFKQVVGEASIGVAPIEWELI
jgi:expansin (peptidoglycan-binding protein)